MQTLKIVNVRFIRHNAKGQTINLVILDLANGKPSIVRPAKAFIQDLENSFIVTGLNSVNDPRFMNAMRDLRGATATGDITHHKAGDKWTVTADSPMVTDATHPKFGTVQAGDQLAYEKDGTRVEAFLTYDLPERVLARQANANALAQIQAQLMGAFDTQASSVESADAPVEVVEGDEAFDPNTIPTNVVDGATTDVN